MSELESHNLPRLSTKGAETIGLLRNFEEEYPKEFEKLLGFVNLDTSREFPNRNFSSNQFGLKTTMDLYVIGRAGGKYFLSVHDFGNPVFSVPEEQINELGFDPSKFNWQEPQK
jgi:hypothetical protein